MGTCLNVHKKNIVLYNELCQTNEEREGMKEREREEGGQ